MRPPLRAPLLVALLTGLAGCSTAAASPEPRPSLQGIVEHDERRLAFELGGRVRRVSVVTGDRVEPDSVVAELDDSLQRPLRALREREVDVARAQLELARAGSRGQDVRATRAQLRAAERTERLVARQLARQRGLVQKGAAAESRLDALEAELARARAEREALAQRLSAQSAGARPEELKVAEARARAAESGVAVEDVRLRHHVLAAGLRGAVLDVHVEPGEVVAPGTPIATIADVKHPYVDVFVPQADLGGIRVGAPARVRVDSLPDALPGRVENVARRTEFTPRFLFSERERPNLVVRVRVRVEDPGERLHAGVPAFVDISREAAGAGPAPGSAR